MTALRQGAYLIREARPAMTKPQPRDGELLHHPKTGNSSKNIDTPQRVNDAQMQATRTRTDTSASSR